jgi:glycolate oxidase FAD binding subunit
MQHYQPGNTREVQEVVTAAASTRQRLAISGGGSKQGYGRPVEAMAKLDLRKVAGIIDYDPSELVLTARAATPMSEILGELRERNQMLAFEPPDWGNLLPSDGQPTLGGVVSCNLAGPRRVRAGAARDHFLGFEAVNGRGEVWRGGGRVVKNVTGYDMSKLQAGALGTLSALTEITVRVVPRPETSCSVVLDGLQDEGAVRVMADGLNSPHEVSAAAHLPAGIALRAAFAALAGVGTAVTLLRLEGHGPSVSFRADALARTLGATRILDDADSRAIWAAIGSVQPLLSGADRLIWRVCTTPGLAAAALSQIRSRLQATEGYFDWGGGLLWLALDPVEAGSDGGAQVIRGIVGKLGGHATLLRAPELLRRVVPVFDVPEPALAALNRRIKASFDPQAILNPGRMHEGY